MKHISMRLANIPLDLSPANFQLPEMVTFFDMFEVSEQPTAKARGLPGSSAKIC
jgi:hypothetical protein